MSPSNNKDSASSDDDKGGFQFGPNLESSTEEKLRDLSEPASLAPRNYKLYLENYHSMLSSSIQSEEYRERRQQLLKYVNLHGHDGVVLFRLTNIEYLFGMVLRPLERPVAAGITEDDIQFVVPKIEASNLKSWGIDMESMHVYFDYPQGRPIEKVVKMCDALGLADGSILVDSDGSPGRYGYRGPPLSDLIASNVEVDSIISDFRMSKSETEIDLIHMASIWANLGHRVLQKELEPGSPPEVVSRNVEAAMLEQLVSGLGDWFEESGGTPPTRRSIEASCSLQYFPIQGSMADLRASYPAGRLSEGDILISIVKTIISGYHTELERTMFIGEPTDEQRKYFEIMKEGQSIAIDMLEPGVEFAAVEDAIDNYFSEHNVEDFTHHHIGHNIGLEAHELPVIDRGYEGSFSEGEVYTIEPGFYIPDVGSFRHSDTVAVTKNDPEILTRYPRDIETLTIDPE